MGGACTPSRTDMFRAVWYSYGSLLVVLCSRHFVVWKARMSVIFPPLSSYSLQVGHAQPCGIRAHRQVDRGCTSLKACKQPRDTYDKTSKSRFSKAKCSLDGLCESPRDARANDFGSITRPFSCLDTWQPFSSMVKDTLPPQGQCKKNRVPMLLLSYLQQAAHELEEAF